MLPAGTANKLFQGDLEFSPARKPRLVDSVAGPIDIAAPNALKAKQNITIQLWPRLLQLIRKPDYGRRRQSFYRSKWPLLFGPFIRGHKLDLLTGFGDSLCKSL